MNSADPGLIDYLDRLCRHASPGGVPPATLALGESPEDPEDIVICERVIRAFHKALLRERESVPESRRPSGGIWGHIKACCYQELSRALREEDAHGLARLFRNGLRTGITCGFDGICGVDMTFAGFSTAGEVSGQMVKITIDRLVTLAEALGLLPLELPEHGRWGENLYTNLEALVPRLEAEMGHEIGMPRVFGMFGLAAAGKLIAIRTPEYLYAAWKMKRLLGTPAQSIVEIGAGLGGVAYYSVLGGTKRYSIVDLPYVNTMQAFFLIKGLGGATVRLFAEKERGQAVHVLPYWCLHEMGERSADLCYNQDSLPEIREDIARDVISRIAYVAAGGFYSVNQEAETSMGYLDGARQLLASRLVEQNGRFERRQRNLHWIRKGYVEEFYKVR